MSSFALAIWSPCRATLDDARASRSRVAELATLAVSRSGERGGAGERVHARAGAPRRPARHRSQLSAEQRAALKTITARGGIRVLVGQAGTGKGVVVAAAAGAWRREGYEVVGTAVAGATAERLGADAGLERSMTTDALLARVQSDASPRRKDGRRDGRGRHGRHQSPRGARGGHGQTESKLVLVGDHAQLPAIGAGGMFAELQEQVPTARGQRGPSRQAGVGARGVASAARGESERALASYQAHGRLHISDTREAGGRADGRAMGPGPPGAPG